MFVNGVEIISSKLNNIKLDSFGYQSDMHPDTKTSQGCGKNQLPLLQFTPSNTSQKRNESGSPGNDPYLLKPQHDIPPTPPPQAEQKSENPFPQRIG